jgi:Flp pilus assembly protein TadD
MSENLVTETTDQSIESSSASQVEPKEQTPAWMGWVEKAAIVGAIGGSVVSAVTQQVLFVSVPLSVAAALSFADRQRMKSALAMAAADAQTKIEVVAAEATAKAELVAREADTMNQIQVIQLNRTNHMAMEGISALQFDVEKLKQQTEDLVQKQEALIGSTFEESYYRRGLEYEKKGEYKAAISAYAEALRLNPGYAIAHMQRGLAYANLGQKQQAIADLRMSTKMFFESGDLENYHKARSMSEAVHAGESIDTAVPAQASQRVVVDELFV